MCIILKEFFHNVRLPLVHVMNEPKSSEPPKPYHPATRWLHAGLALGVMFQLICAFLMAHPEHADGGHGMAMTHSESVTEEMHHPLSASKDELGETFMSAHRVGGLFVAFIVVANLIWAVIRRGELRKRQIAVLVSAAHWRESGQILKKLSLMLVGQGGLPEPGNALSLIVEMLGMLTMTAMAVSGAIIWSVWAGSDNTVTEQAESWMGIHATVAMFLFLYLVGHVSMALLHMRSGDAVFTRIRP